MAAKVERMVIIGLCVLSLILPADWPGEGFWVGGWLMRGAEKYFGEFVCLTSGSSFCLS